MIVKYNNRLIFTIKYIFNNFNKIYFNPIHTTSIYNHDSSIESSPAESVEDDSLTNFKDKNVKLVEYTFNWGIGNKYIQQSRNRIRPTHMKKVTTVTIPSNYFDVIHKFDNCKLVFDNVNEQWEVLWLEYNKLNGKPFPIKKYGVHESKRQAIEFAKELNDKLRNSNNNNHNYNDKDSNEEQHISFDNILQCWVGLGRAGSRPIARAYSADYHGFENSKRLSKSLNKSN